MTASVLDLAGLHAAGAQALGASAHGPFEVRRGLDGPDALWPEVDPPCDAVLLAVTQDDEGADVLLPDTAVLVVAVDPHPRLALHWLQRGAQDVLSRDEFDGDGDALARRIRGAIERKRIERNTRKSYATDLDTGLPHQQQLIEHMSQLLALREREPSPMAVLVLRVEGLASVRARLGAEAANVLRRKVGVRLRAGVRASDVVASLADDSFGVLLGAMLAPADAARVGAKLLAAVLTPFKVSGNDVALAASLGIAQYPEDGAQAEVLLRRAAGLAASAPAQGRLGHANFDERGGHVPTAANDD